MKLTIDKLKQFNFDYQVIEGYHAKYNEAYKFLKQALDEQRIAFDKSIDEYLRKENI